MAGWMVIEHAEYLIAELFVERPRLEAEAAEERPWQPRSTA